MVSLWIFVFFVFQPRARMLSKLMVLSRADADDWWPPAFQSFDLRLNTAFERWVSVPTRQTTTWICGDGFNGFLKRKERYDRFGHRKETISRSHRNRGRMVASGLKVDLAG